MCSFASHLSPLASILTCFHRPEHLAILISSLIGEFCFLNLTFSLTFSWCFQHSVCPCTWSTHPCRLCSQFLSHLLPCPIDGACGCVNKIPCVPLSALCLVVFVTLQASCSFSCLISPHFVFTLPSHRQGQLSLHSDLHVLHHLVMSVACHHSGGIMGANIYHLTQTCNHLSQSSLSFYVVHFTSFNLHLMLSISCISSLPVVQLFSRLCCSMGVITTHSASR